jgi:hypothetical protein
MGAVETPEKEENVDRYTEGLRDGQDLTKPFPTIEADGEFVEGFLRGRIQEARENEQATEPPVSREEYYPLPCPAGELEEVLNYHGPYGALRMVREYPTFHPSR